MSKVKKYYNYVSDSILTHRVRTFFAYLFALLTLVLFMWFVFERLPRSLTFQSILGSTNRVVFILKGMGLTLLVSFITLFGSMVLGFIFYLLQKSKIKYFNALVDVFTEIIYGTPMIVMIVVMAFVIGPAFGNLERNFFGILGLVLYMSPYMKNVFQSAISSVSEEQYLAMDLFGFTSYQKYRYIILPQVARVLMPPLMNNFSIIIKGSALLHVISYPEMYQAFLEIQSKTYLFIETYFIMWVLYLMITIPLSQLTKLVERKWAL